MNSAFPYLDLAIAISFVYLLMALICTTITESLAGIFNSRGTTLAKGITELLRDPVLKQLVYDHPLVQGIQQGTDARLPSYLASNKFALALMDILTQDSPANDPVALRQGIEALANPETRTVLNAVLADSSSLKNDQQRIEAWYEDNMNRVSGWYKRTSQIRVFVLAALVTVLLNADTMKMLKVLWYNPTKSALVLEDAKKRQQQGVASQDKSTNLVITPEEEQQLEQVTGWSGDWYPDWKNQQQKDNSFSQWLQYLAKQRLAGWVITMLAVSLGAPFWFDALNKFMNVRNAGVPPPTLADRLSAEKTS
jgi:hypothetical protein